MITTLILEEKYRVQRKLTEEAGYDVRKYAELCHKMAVEAAEKYGLTLKYGQREGGELEPVVSVPPQGESRSVVRDTG